MEHVPADLRPMERTQQKALDDTAMESERSVDNASLPCFALPISESERQEWHKPKKIPREPATVENSARLHAYDLESQSVLIHVNTDQLPIYARVAEVRLPLPQSREWLHTEGVVLGISTDMRNLGDMLMIDEEMSSKLLGPSSYPPDNLNERRYRDDEGWK
jgi:hypothetical protein